MLLSQSKLGHPRAFTRLTTAGAALSLAALLVAGAAWAADTGPRPHAEGKYDTVTETYVVVEGDDLFAISERFKIPVDTLKASNKLESATVKAGQKLAVGPAHAHKSASHQASAKKPMSKMTCEEFVGLDESFQPKAVYWAVAYGSKGQPEAEAVEVDGVEKVVPFVVDECKKAPKETFWQKVQAEWKKMEQKL
jgi:mannose-6-phosphate isomerase-like protein (cupin superfamily)